MYTGDLRELHYCIVQTGVINLCLIYDMLLVFRGAEDTFDVSADLQELARTPVTVVSSGVKSILGM